MASPPSKAQRNAETVSIWTDSGTPDSRAQPEGRDQRGRGWQISSGAPQTYPGHCRQITQDQGRSGASPRPLQSRADDYSVDDPPKKQLSEVNKARRAFFRNCAIFGALFIAFLIATVSGAGAAAVITLLAVAMLALIIFLWSSHDVDSAERSAQNWDENLGKKTLLCILLPPAAIYFYMKEGYEQPQPPEQST